MFSKKNQDNSLGTYTQQNTISYGTIIKGDIQSEGDFRIEGTVHGNVITKGKVVIGKTGLLNGTLKSVNSDIEGHFKGKLILTETLSIKSTAKIEGEVEVGKLSVEPGAIFNAVCLMKGTVKELINSEQESKKEQSA